MSNKKIKALFLALILISSVFTISLLNIENVSAQKQETCCEKTIDGEFCQYTSKDKCASNSREISATCAQSSFCKVGSCFIEAEGKCFKKVGKANCIAKKGEFFDSADCNIPLAREGCCMIGDEAFFTTQARCKLETAKFPNVNMVFDEGIQSEALCLQKSFSEDLGACVKEDGRCVLTTQQLCNVQEKDVKGIKVGFHKGFLCSNSALGTECARQQTTKCSQEDVYWFDSCGNKENIYNANKEISYNNGFILNDQQQQEICKADSNDPRCGNCDYTSGTICGNATSVKPVVGNFICKSTACTDITKSAPSPSAGNAKKSGESWCLYDGAVGQGRDLVGSRHFRTVCINGEEIVEPCKDFREELCFEDKINDNSLQEAGIQQGFNEAACRFNRWESCTECNEAELCGGECDGLEDPFKGTELNEAQTACCAKKCCEDRAARDCYWNPSGISAVALPQEILRTYGGVCTPDVPPGIKFWSDDIKFIESTTRGKAADVSLSSFSPKATDSVCEAGSLECNVKWRRGGASRIFGRDSWEVIQNEHCTKPEWVIAGNNYCKSLGDCGAYFNIAGDASLDGYTNTASSEREKDGLYFDGYKLQKKDLGDFSKLTSTDVNKDIPSSWNYFIPGGPIALTALIGLGVTAKVLGTWTISRLGIPFAKLGFKTLFQKTVAGKAIAGTAQKLSVTGVRIFAAVNIALWAYTVYSIVDVVFAQTKEKNYQIGCGIWQPIKGGSKCELCNQDPKKPCSEYRCKSLGQQCGLINKGKKEEKCVAINIDDVRSPKITPFRNVIKGNIDETPSGYRLIEKVEPFTPVTLGILTDEPAQCRFDKDLGKKYDDMTAFFGTNLYINEHQIELNLPAELTSKEALALTNQGEHTLYIKCQDAAGNQNEADYFIRFNVKPGPDLTPPKIEEVSPLNKAFIRNDINETSVDIFVNEPSECRWDKSDLDYGNMKNDFECQTSGFITSTLHYGLYECKTKLSSLTTGENKFFFKCKDQPGKEEKDRNVMQQSFAYSLTKTSKLNIDKIEPTGTIFNGNITLKVITSNGAENGKAICAFSEKESDEFFNKVEFINTNSKVHEQSLILGTARYNYFVTCQDIAGNEVKGKTSFDVAVDLSRPEILRIYSTASSLNIELDEEVNCEFSNKQFNFGTGTLMTKSQGTHSAPLADKLNIICKDAFDNQLSFVVYP